MDSMEDIQENISYMFISTKWEIQRRILQIVATVGLITVPIRRDGRRRSFKEAVDNFDEGLVTVHPSCAG
jgi:hypothetical protein